MAEWVLIENNKITEYHDKLPENWKNYSGLNLSENNLDFLNSIGWYKVLKVEKQYDVNRQILKNYVYEFNNNMVTETPVIEDLDDESYNAILKRNIELFKEKLRKERDLRLKESDWTQSPDLVGIKPSTWLDLWKTYRQELRDIPEKYPLPTDISWPEPPKIN